MHTPRTQIMVALTLIGLAGLGTGCAADAGTHVSTTPPASATVSAGTSGHVPAPPGRPIVLDEHANRTVIYVRAGATVELLLHSSYWTILGSSRPAVLAQDGPTRQLPVTPTCPPGIGCNPLQAMFIAQSPGTAVLSASRTSCGEALRCGPQNGSFRVTVIVTQ
jgi:hypothetical protein